MPSQQTPAFAAPTASPSMDECHSDLDCVTSGCSGELCQPKNQPRGITPCIYLPQYACFKASGCLCQSGKCAWSSATLQCLNDFNKPAGQTQAEAACQSLCLQQKAAGQDLSAGPCLSNAVTPGWVCDVAHNPRIPADNLPQNMCQAYLASAKHFVEVDENCQVIRSA